VPAKPDELDSAALPPSPGSPSPALIRPLRVVAIGGGTGLSTLLRGLRRHVTAPGTESGADPASRYLISDLAAVVSVTDDGGSSGRLRQHFNMLPPGDLRNCMVALSEEEDLLSRLFNHRFRAGESLQGHNFGNLFVAALTEITGDFAHAIQLASKVLATRGRIYPVTNANTTLIARMNDGSLVYGETNINASNKSIAELMLDPPDPVPLPETIEAIERADLITVGPGSLYTSLITNLLVKDMSAALARTRAVRVFICNLMTEANESLGLTASEHILRIYEHTRAPIFDFALLNIAPFSADTLERYKAEGAEPIVADIQRVEALGVRCIAGDFSSEDGVVRHSARVTGAILALGHTRSSRGTSDPELA